MLSCLSILGAKTNVYGYRTKEQLGYVVESSPRVTYRVFGFCFCIQSSEYNPVYLQGRIENFLNGLDELLVSILDSFNLHVLSLFASSWTAILIFQLTWLWFWKCYKSTTPPCYFLWKEETDANSKMLWICYVQSWNLLSSSNNGINIVVSLNNCLSSRSQTMRNPTTWFNACYIIVVLNSMINKRLGKNREREAGILLIKFSLYLFVAKLCLCFEFS